MIALPRPTEPTSLPAILLALALGSLGPALAAQNVLLIVADDLGVDRVAAYGEHPDPGNTPVIDALAADGILFRNAWTPPSCSPSRATLLTGRFGFRTGVGRALGGPDISGKSPGLPLSETTIPELLSPGHVSWAAGKWHLTSDPGQLIHPLEQGFASHKGSYTNLPGGPFGDTYSNFKKAVDGVYVTSRTYATTDTVNDAIDFIQNQGAGAPWFLWLAFNAPHAPIHKPPAQLHGFNLPADIPSNIPIHVKAAVEAMDTELGRLFTSVDPTVLDQTLVIFVGDNGTTPQATTAPFDPDHAKTTVYEGGINVPLIVSGPGVARGAESAGLVTTTDLYATLAEYLGVPLVGGDDSESMLPYFTHPARPSLRPWAYTEFFSPVGFGPYDRWDQAIRDERYKLLRFHDDSVLPTREEFYDLDLDPFEQDDLLLQGSLSSAQTTALAALRASVKAVVGPWKTVGNGLATSVPLVAQGSAMTHAGSSLPGPRIKPHIPRIYRPSLTGDGDLLGGHTVSLSVEGAPPLFDATLFIGDSQANMPYKGGTLVPSPDQIITNLTTDASGALVYQTTWPMGLPADQVFYYQIWFRHPTTGAVNSATNGLAAITP